MKNKKDIRLIKPFGFYYTELPAIDEYLEKKESEGYRLKEIDGNNMVFEKCEPALCRYCAEIFTASSPDEFIEACALEGWEHIGTYNSELYIFRTRKHDAIDIMTDEAEKNKIIGKRIFRQKNMWFLLVLAVLRVIRTFMFSDSSLSISLPETDPWIFFSLAIVAYWLFDTFIRVFDCLLWKFKANRDTSLFSLSSTVKKRIIYLAVSFAAALVIGYICLWAVPDEPYVIAIGLILALPLPSNLPISKIHSEKTQRLKALLSFLCLTAVIASFAYTLYETKDLYGKTDSAKINEKTYTAESLPIEAPDLGITVEYENELFGDDTRFGQLYTFTSDPTTPGNYLSYDILVTDYPRVSERYVEKILRKYEEFGAEITKVSGDKTQWDYYYRITRGGDYEYDGFAVKDNTVLYLRWSVCCEKNFFELAYDNIFD